jgi:hypothetical protein
LEPGLFRSERQHSSAYNTNSVIEVPSVYIELKTEKQVGDLDGRFFFFFIKFDYGFQPVILLYSIQNQFLTTKSNRLSPKTRVGFKGGKFSKYS